MKKNLFALFGPLLLTLISLVTFGQQMQPKKRTLYIVRHAEKDTGANPRISKTGMKRAGDLYQKLKNEKIDLIFVSQYRRTGMTADSLRIYQNIDTVHYKADATADNLFSTLNSRAGKAKRILIVGHSNTIPAIIRKAGIESFVIDELPETEFDNIFIIQQKSGKAIRFKQIKFGERSVSGKKPAAPKMKLDQ